jgi:hypothetical protein
VEATREAGEKAADAARDAADRADHAAARQLAQAQRLADAQYETQEAIHRAADQNHLLARDGWKLQVTSKVQRGLELLNNDMFEEASSILRNALATDPGNLFAHIYLALAERSSGNSAEYWLHLQKGAQLLGTIDYSTLGAYRETLAAFSVPSGQEKDPKVLILRDVFFKRLQAYFASRPSDLDIPLLQEIVDRGWDDIARLGVDVIDARRLSLQFVQIVMKQDCYETAALAAEKLVEVAATRKDISAWLQCSLTAWQIKRNAGRGTPEKGVRFLTGWKIEEVATLLDEFVTQRDTMSRSFSEAAWVSLASALRSYYRQVREAMYEYLDRTARARSASTPTNAVIVGVASAIITLLVLAGISALFDATQAFVFLIVGVAFGAGVVATNLRGTSARTKAFTEHQTHLRALQLRIERAIGFASEPSKPSSTPKEIANSELTSAANENLRYVYPRQRDASEEPGRSMET